MSIKTISSTPFPDQKPGTSGLRKSVAQFSQDHYLENFVQALFNTLDTQGLTLSLGGDGRYLNDRAIQTIIRMAAANGVSKLIVGQHGLMSTPVASAIIRKHALNGGIILSASHNPGGPDGDFGIKYNEGHGGPARENVTDAIYQNTLTTNHYRLVEAEDVDISSVGHFKLATMQVMVIDTTDDYNDLLQQLFDFDLIHDYFSRPETGIAFDAMHAVTGPYASRILQQLCTKESLQLLNCTPLPNFGNGHPDPSPAHAQELVQIMNAKTAPTLGAASDGDGDRNMILGKHCFVSPSDSLAILTANATLIPAYASGLNGVARSMPTSRAVDRVADSLEIPCYETPTGWKFFGNLLDAGSITLCGEESFGTGSNHIREKDGLWAVLFWLNLVAARDMPVKEIMLDHWQKFGRNIYCRHDYEGLETEAANDIMTHLTDSFERINKQEKCQADEFSYHDPVDGSVSDHQGIRLQYEDQSRIVYRLSGTGTQGATLRVYLESLSTNADAFTSEASQHLSNLGSRAANIADIEKITGRTQPSVIV